MLYLWNSSLKHSPRKPLETTDVEKKGPELGKQKGERKIYGVVSILIFSSLCGIQNQLAGNGETPAGYLVEAVSNVKFLLTESLHCLADGR